jgi:bifunctional enzyme CysN/CysC
VSTVVETQSQLRVVTVGHVDHGKSTLIGRLLNDTGNLPEGKVEELRAISERRGVAFEWSFVLDALQSERDQAITIDTTRIWLRTPQREVVLIDAPGHKEFLRNMVTGASDADAALLVVDARDGVSEQTRRHALLLELIGVEQVVVAVNKMDSVGFDEARFEEIRRELGPILERIGIAPRAFVPISARGGDMVAERGTNLPWYTGPTVFTAMLALDRRSRATDGSLRIAVQGVVRHDLQRIFVGRVISGTLSVGDEIMVSPARRTAHVRSIETWPHAPKAEARTGESVGFTLDGPLYVDRGDVVSSVGEAPTLSKIFRARLLWLGQRLLHVGDRFRLQIGTRQANVEVDSFDRIIDIESLNRNDADAVQTHDVAEVVLRSSELLALDRVARHAELGRFILLDGLDIVAGGTVLDVLTNPKAQNTKNLVAVALLDNDSRAWSNGHRGAVIWLTGLPAAGKSTIAVAVERRLFEQGHHAYVLDGDNLRQGLNSDLGFSPEDRHENIRRAGEVAALFADAGIIAIASFISPHRADRELARRAAGKDFHEIYVKADTALCEARDPKGHYRKARAGEIPDFTGINNDYEPPLDPRLTLDTGTLSVDECVAAVLDYIDDHVAIRETIDPEELEIA